MADKTDWTVPQALEAIRQAAGAGKLSSGAVENLTRWLEEPRYAEYVPQIFEHLAAEKWQALDDAFWTQIPFGTGGRRGRMYPIGSNAINDRTIGESAQGLAEYIKSVSGGDARLSCALAYDTRHNSRHFAELCASIMVAAGFKVYFLDDYRSTPELSFLVRLKRCTCGIMVTASHNPPSDNAVKVYWSTGGQVLPPHDAKIISQVDQVQQLERVDFAQAVAAGDVEICTAEVDAAYLDAVVAQQHPGPRELRVLYSPLHGVGEFSVCGALRGAGFREVHVYAPHSERSGDFPNVPEHVSNPENPAVFEAIVAEGQQTQADLILATDPDCDRMGCAAPLTTDPAGPWKTLTGNQLGALLCDYLLDKARQAGTLSSEHYVVTTLVTTKMIRRIAESYGARTFDELLVGFKWICGTMDDVGPDKFVFGTEESHGYLAGQYARDKDGAVACLLLSELAAELKHSGQSLHEKLDALYWQHGYHGEQLLNRRMEGSRGMEDMQRLMELLRTNPPAQLGGLDVVGVRDYLNQQTLRQGQATPLAGPRGNLVILDLQEPGNYVAVRPSGTEPKVKFYLFGYTPPEQLTDLDEIKQQVAERLAACEQDCRELAP